MYLLKLGGSLITDKTREKSVRGDVLARLADEIAAALPVLGAPLLLGHGSGSFGHAAAKRHNSRAGVSTPEQWRGFAEVSVAAQQLNRIVADALHTAGVPVFSVAPSSSVRCEDGRITHIDTAPLARALDNGLVPLVMGDVAFDSVRGGTIISTEEIFAYLAKHFPVQRVLLAGETEGVFASMDDRRVLARIVPRDWAAISGGLGGSRGADVTGGMAAKVRDMLALAQAHPGLSVHIFSGLAPNTTTRVLRGERVGTEVVAEDPSQGSGQAGGPQTADGR
jgi:isopentenyl phosphate kinase